MSGSSLGARIIRATALLAGLLVLVLSVVSSALTSRAKQIAAQDAQLTTVLGQQVDALDSSFERAHALTLLLADNPAFAEFYRAPGTAAAKVRAGGPVMHQINMALVSLAQLYPGRIGKAAFIDRSGREIARVVNSVPVRPNLLSSSEAADPFFATAIALPVGQVYQAQAYESANTHNEVIANSTVVDTAAGTGLLRFDIALASAGMADGLGTAIVDARTGETLTGDQTFQDLGNDAGTITSGERRVAYRKVPASAGNVNSWYVVVSAPEFGRGWTRGVGVGSLALLSAALLTMLVAGVSWGAHQRATRRAALHDALTGLPNRTHLVERLGRALHVRRRRDDGPVAVLILDLDRFKEVNDLFGDHYGDLLLNEVARRLTEVAGGEALVARLGGDEFAVLPATIADPAAVGRLAERLLAAVEDSFVVHGVTLDIEASVGAAIAPEHGSEPEELVRHAEAAVFAAKDRRTGYQLYDPATNDHAPNRLALLGDLRRALDADDQLLLFYQPKVDLRDGRLVGVEALIRWRHPERGMTPPDAFIPVAETTTLIQALTTKVLDLALGQAATWLAAGLHIPVAVNLSARCLLDPTLPARVLDLLDRHGVPAALLHLEITESAIMADPDQALCILRDLHDAGIQLSLDDFGTGHSSMAYLKRLPVDELKVDKSFVKEVAHDAGDRVLVRSVIDLGHNLGLTVVAEGVEDERVMAVLRDFGCDIVQGYHLGRPAPAADLDPRLAATASRAVDARGRLSA